MDAIIFVTRALVITIALVFIMQVNVGDERLEYKVADFIRSSKMTTTLQGVADGAVKLVRNTWNKASKTLNTGFSNAISSGNRPGERVDTVINWERSKEFVKEKAISTRERVENRLRKEGIIQERADKDAIDTE